ncbi:universal stress protein [Rasiella rasia]|uniref:Universal stress protein n=1 Tax=Rasiella rasia TaxID=2744027 RepID=A0A6G6GMI1_9FLAO|nr:universal stress protein [Rasiella rasia]QIE59727.1 universal stress protein [Rasiella rasia]
MKTILVPTDFSPHSENALRAAASIAKNNDAKIVVVHMAGIKDSHLTKEEASTALESVFYLKLSEKRFAEFLDKSYLEGVKVSEVIRKHKSFTELNDVAKEHDASLIVMSSHGSSGWEEMLIGSNTEKVVRTADIPVLVVKQLVSDFKIDTGVFASDFSLENTEAFEKAQRFFKEFDTVMNMVYVNTPGPDFRNSKEIDEVLFKFFEATGAKNPSEEVSKVAIVSDYTIEGGIFMFSQMLDADIIVIPTHGRRGLSHLLKGSLSEDIANHAIVPVLTIKL